VCFSSSSARRLTVSAVAFVVFVGVLELVARFAYDAPWHERLVDEQARHVELDYDRNIYNLRGPAYDYDKPEGTRRVLVLGDSFTFGLGVQDDDATFARILERELTASAIGDGGPVEVLNGGIIGSLTDLWVELWDAAKDPFAPDVVLIVFFLRDGTLATSIPAFFDDIRDEVAERNAESILYQSSYAYRTLRDARDGAAIRANYTAEFQAAYFGDESQTAEWVRARANLRRLHADARARSVPFGFAVFPVLAGLRGDDYPFQGICDLLADFASDEGMAVHALLPDFRGLAGPDLWVSALDQHPNEEAHRIAARSLLPFVAELLNDGMDASSHTAETD
jgi:lysophospholipase L1-like esterase